MDQASWVIRVLEDSKGGKIEYSNWLWLRQNVEKLHIRVCVEDCVVNTFDIAERWAEEATILIQEGKNVQFKGDFHPEKEALLLVRYEPEDDYWVYHYLPKE